MWETILEGFAEKGSGVTNMIGGLATTNRGRTQHIQLGVSRN